MKPNIKEMLDGMEEGDVVPSIIGTYVGSSMVKVKGSSSLREYALIDDGNTSVKVRIDDPDHHLNGKVEMGKIVAFTSSKTHEGNIGLRYSVNKDGEPVVIVGGKAQITVQQELFDDEKKEVPKPAREKKSEKMTHFEKAATSAIRAKMYLYAFVKEMVLHMDPDYPVEHLPAFTTSVFMDLKHDNISIPTGEVSVTERSSEPEKTTSVVATTKKGSTSTSKSSWREVLHPTTKKQLGELTVEEIKKKLTSWYFAQDPSRLGKSAVSFFNAVGECFEENGYTPEDAALFYRKDYLESYPSDSKKKLNIIDHIAKQAFNAGLTEEDESFKSTGAAIEYIKKFKDFFENAVKAR